jgi:hypothetical protein
MNSYSTPYLCILKTGVTFNVFLCPTLTHIAFTDIRQTHKILAEISIGTQLYRREQDRKVALKYISHSHYGGMKNEHFLACDSA